MGRKVIATDQKQLDMQMLPFGTYLLKVTTPINTKSFKIINQNYYDIWRFTF